RGYLGIEEIDDLQPQIPIQDTEVEVGIVKDLLDLLVGKERREDGQLRDLERVDEDLLVRRGYLDEADAVMIAMVPGRLGVDTEYVLRGKPFNRASQLLWSGDVLVIHSRGVVLPPIVERKKGTSRYRP